MNVLVPLNNLEHLSEYISAGASEFYIGFYDEAWKKKFGEYMDINRLSGFGKEANPYSFKEVLSLIPRIKEQGQMIYVTFNASIYSEEQLGEIKNYFLELKKTRVDGVIVSCMELVLLAKECGINSVASTICGIYNSDLARIYYKAGAKRLILPRDLSTEEVCNIAAAVPEAEYEVFMMRNGCSFSDSNCLGFHRTETCAICGSLAKAGHDLHLRKENFHSVNNAELNDELYTNQFHKYTCGLCSIYDFVKSGISAAKIVGRSDDWEYICKDISYVYENERIAKQCKTREEYLEKMIFPEGRKEMCKLGLSCYYPEVRFS
ncbi:MAG: U32 family peptidase [bacterium]|nr:U32 family peptidase [bacterium]